jgi:sacsin
MKILSEDLMQSQVRDFLVDLDQTYTYLQDRLYDSKAGFNLGNIAIWLNLDTPDHSNVQLEDIASSWQGIEHLVAPSLTRLSHARRSTSPAQFPNRCDNSERKENS